MAARPLRTRASADRLLGARPQRGASCAAVRSAGPAISAGFARGEALLRVAHGYPPARILEAAQDMEADLIVIATHGRSGLEAAFVGSVALRVALEARGDALFVRSKPGAGESAAAQAPGQVS